MLDFEIIYILFLYVIFLPIYFLAGGSKKKIFIHSIFFIYLLSVLSVTLLPIPLEGVEDLIEAEVGLKNNFYPLHSILEIIDRNSFNIILRQIGGNLLLLMPFGFLVPIIWKNKAKFWKIILLGLFFSLAIEGSQLLISAILNFNYKIFDVDDLILNTLGTMLGYGIYKMWKWTIKDLQ